MAHRMDLLAEINTTLDSSGDYTGDWIDSAGIDTVRIAYSSAGARGLIQESTDQVEIRSAELPVGYGEMPITLRYFRFAVDGGTPNAALRATLRVVTR